MAEVATNLHDLNKMVIGQMQPLEKEEVMKLVGKINDLMSEHRQYFMLLSNEKRDYTVFNLIKRKEKALGAQVVEVLESRGVIKDYDVKGNDAIEFWVDDTFYALFPYDLGVVEC